METPSSIHEIVHPEFTFRPQFDIIIDFVWLVANNAAAICHQIHEFKHNFWTNYIETFQDAYLSRVQQQW